MKSILFAAATLLNAASALSPSRVLAMRATPLKGVAKPSEPAMLGVIKPQGCFSSKGDLVLNTTMIWNTIGSCGTDICEKELGKKVGATTGGNQCWCGDTYPPANTRVDDKNCNVGCTGYDQDACGGIKFFSVYNTGLDLDVDYAGGGDAKVSGTVSSPTKPTQTPVDAPKTTIIVNTPPVEEEKSKGTNTAGIAAGVVVGVVVLSALGAALFFFLRRRKNREIEEEHRRNAAVSSFMGKPPSSSGMSISDARLDPVMAQRRMSDGSIADNQDYSRRILRVTNA